jgi:hypothetical protein
MRTIPKATFLIAAFGTEGGYVLGGLTPGQDFTLAEAVRLDRDMTATTRWFMQVYGYLPYLQVAYDLVSPLYPDDPRTEMVRQWLLDDTDDSLQTRIVQAREELVCNPDTGVFHAQFPMFAMLGIASSLSSISVMAEMAITLFIADQIEAVASISEIKEMVIAEYEKMP